MTVLKWVLVIFGVLFLAVAAILFGAYFWASSIDSVRISTEDLEVGGSYPDDERQALLNACKAKRSGTGDAETVCNCIADRAGTEFSRFERLILTASFEGSPTKIVALTKGLLDSGVPEPRLEEMEQQSNQRTQKLLSSCGLKK